MMVTRWGMSDELGTVSYGENQDEVFLGAEHFAHQPFGQVPWLTDGDLSIFESGAILLHLGERSEALMPSRSARPQRGQGMAVRGAQFGRDGEPALVLVQVLRRTPTTPWMEALRRVPQDPPAQAPGAGAGGTRMAGRDLLVADILMADVLRLVDRFDGLADYPACRDYVARATARPAFVKAHADQMAHFAAAD
jgi:glutathione S-transferase